MFETLEELPGDPILGLAAACRADPNPNKVDLTLGVYMDERGVTPVFEAIRQAQAQLVREETSKVYLPQVGDAEFNSGIRSLLLGEASSALTAGRVMSIQTPGGCGALRLGAELVKSAEPAARVWLSTPSWANHKPLLGSVGLELKNYRYYDSGIHGVDFGGMMADLEQARSTDVVLLHGCCHNPCGADLSRQQWSELAALAQRIGFTPFVDVAYQGMADGIEEDVHGLRLLVNTVPEVIIAASSSKNFGLYRERTGAILVVAADAARARALQSQGTVAARCIYSMPPAHGAILAGMVFSSEQLNQLWRRELAAMCERMNSLRTLLVEKLNAATGADFNFIRGEKGMFSLLGLSAEQVQRLRTGHSVYILGSSRINIAGINPDNIDYLATSVASVMRSHNSVR